MVTITDDAVEQLKAFLDDQGTPEFALRVFVAPGGCSGLQYGMSVEEVIEEGDTVIESHGVRLLVDEFSAMYLGGAEIDSGAGQLKPMAGGDPLPVKLDAIAEVIRFSEKVSKE